MLQFTKMAIVYPQKDLCFLRLLLEGQDFLGAPGKLFLQLGHLLVKVNLGRGCGGKVISKLLQLDGRISSKVI